MRTMGRSAWVVAAAAAAMFAAGAARGAEAEVGLDFLSSYVWRGITLNDGLVAQPYASVTEAHGFSLNVWGNFDLSDYDGAFEEGEFSEVDLTLSYSLPLGEEAPVGVDVGYVEYLFPHQSDTNGALAGTRDLYAALTVNVPLSPTLTLYYDIDEVEDFYVQFAVGHEFAFGEDSPFTLGLDASLGYIGDDASVGGKAGFNDYNLSATLTYAPTESVSVGGTLGWTDSLDEDVLPDQDVDVWGKIGVVYGF